MLDHGMTNASTTESQRADEASPPSLQSSVASKWRVAPATKLGALSPTVIREEEYSSVRSEFFARCRVLLSAESVARSDQSECRRRGRFEERGELRVGVALPFSSTASGNEVACCLSFLDDSTVSLPTVLLPCNIGQLAAMNYAFPYTRFEAHVHHIYKRLIFKRRLKHLGESSFISPFAILQSMECISIGSRTIIGSGTLIQPLQQYLEDVYTPSIDIGDDAYIGKRCTISGAAEIVIGNETTVGDHVYIGGGRHGYEDLDKGVRAQRLVCGSVRIGPRAWIGYGSFVASTGQLEIGEHAVVAANSVVNQSVPAFTVVAGSPARPIKYFDRNKGEWVRV